MRILIETPTWLGDSVMATSAIENLVNYYEESEVTLIGSFISIEVCKHHPRITNTYVIRKEYTSLYTGEEICSSFITSKKGVFFLSKLPQYLSINLMI